MPPFLADLADRIEAELRMLGAWEAESARPSAEVLAAAAPAPFGGEAMAFTQWLQWVLLERIRSGVVPSSSQVGAYATRELDGWPEADGVVALLQDLDDRINAGSPEPADDNEPRGGFWEKVFRLLGP